MERKPFPDDIEEEEKEEPEEPEKPKEKTPIEWSRWLSIAASLAAIVTISVVTFDMAVGPVRFRIIVAYALGSSLLIAALLVLVIAFKYALSKFEPGLWRYAFWFMSITIAFIYYLLFAYLVFSKFAPLLVRMMDAAMSNAP